MIYIEIGSNDKEVWLIAGSTGYHDPSLPGLSSAPVSSSDEFNNTNNKSGDSSDFSDVS